MRSADSSSFSPSTGAPLVSERGGGVARKQGFGVRAWLLVDEHGGTQVVEAGKHAIMKRTALPARDLRILDPLLSYPSTILGRESAIVINLEHIKAIITAQEILLLNSTDPAVALFLFLCSENCNFQFVGGRHSGESLQVSKDQWRRLQVNPIPI